MKQAIVRGMVDGYNFEIAWGANGQLLVSSICQDFAIVVDDPFGGEKYFFVLCDICLYLHVKKISEMVGAMIRRLKTHCFNCKIIGTMGGRICKLLC
jgi:hypothetical protein